MLALERRNLILEKLQAEKKVVVSELSQLYEVSEETIRRDLDKLERDGRPLSRAGNLNAMYEMCEKRYLRFADYIIDNNRALEDTVEDIRKVIL